MNMKTKMLSSRTQSGMILLEALLSILLFAIGILGLVGLEAKMIKRADDARYRTEATYIAQQQIARIWATDPANLSTLGSIDDLPPEQLPGGPGVAQRETIRGAVECGGDLNCFMVIVRWKAPGATDVSNVTLVTHV